MAKFVSCREGLARLRDDTLEVLDLPYDDLGSALGAGVRVPELEAAPVRAELPARGKRFGPPVRRPPKIWAVGYAYADHRKETGYRELSAAPYVFMKAPSSVIGPGDTIRLPAVAPDRVDYEGELGVVIGRAASSIEPGEAREVIAGFTICNDVSSRDIQKGELPGRRPSESLAKSFDTFTPTGPMVVTLDELADPWDLELRTYVDGELRQHARTSQLLHPVPELVSFLSKHTTLEPGDLISTGTPGGVGHKQGKFLRSGSVVRIEVDGLGVLENAVG